MADHIGGGGSQKPRVTAKGGTTMTVKRHKREGVTANLSGHVSRTEKDKGDRRQGLSGGKLQVSMKKGYDMTRRRSGENPRGGRIGLGVANLMVAARLGAHWRWRKMATEMTAELELLLANPARLGAVARVSEVAQREDADARVG